MGILSRLFGKSQVRRQPIGTPHDDRAEYRIMLTDAGPNRVLVMRILRRVEDLDYAKAKQIINSTPVLVSDCRRAIDAAHLARSLREAGASVEVSPPLPQQMHDEDGSLSMTEQRERAEALHIGFAQWQSQQSIAHDGPTKVCPNCGATGGPCWSVHGNEQMCKEAVIWIMGQTMSSGRKEEDLPGDVQRRFGVQMTFECPRCKRTISR